MAKSQTAFIFARGGSKGIKNKNIREIAGKPLIAHSILCALNSKYIQNVIVSTDSDEIASVAKTWGAQVLKRPSELASDDSPELLSWRHAIESTNLGSYFISLPATSPLRSSEDVDRAIERYEKKDCDIIFGISPSQRNPYLNMVTRDEKQMLHIVMGNSKAYRRQDVPEVFDITTCVYVSSPDYIKSCEKLMSGRVAGVEIPPWRALDIDEEYDLYLAELMLKYPFHHGQR